jgi:REP element-mobilizing transposase RayT
MTQAPYEMDHIRRDAVLRAIKAVCAHRSWSLYAAHVRTNHIHIVVSAEETPERVMNSFKAYASRKLSELGLDSPTRKRWARHGSTRYLNGDKNISAAIRYIVDDQGDPMSVFEERLF